MKKFVMIATLAVAASVAASANAATFVYQGGLIKVGSKGSQVMALQTCLADMGVNSYSNIDGIFGSKTKAAVMAFQAKKGVAVDGIIGPVTGKIYTNACAEAKAPAANLPAGCTSTVGFSTTTGQKCDATVSNLPAGCTATSMYSSTTGEKCDATTDNTSTKTTKFVLGGDGEITDYKLKREGDVKTDSEMEELANFEFEVKDGDVQLDRVKLFFEETGSPSNTDDLWENFKSVTLKVDGKEIADVDVDSKSDWTKERTGVYSLSLKGTKVFKDGFDGEIKVYVNTSDEVETSSDIAKYNFWGELRFIDGTGVVEEVGNDASYTGTNKVSFDIDALAAFRISFSENRNSPDTNKSLDLSSAVNDETLVIVDADVRDNQNGTLEDARVTLTVTGGSQISSGTTGTAALADLVDEVSIYIDGTKIDSVSTAEGETATVNNATVTGLTDVAATATHYVYKFDLSDYEVKKDKEYKIEVKADFSKVKSTDKLAGSTVMVSGLTFKGEDQAGTNIAFANSNVTGSTSYAPTFTASAGDIKVTWVSDPVVYKDAVDTNYDGEFIVVKVNIDNDSGAAINALETISNWVFDVDGYAINMAATYSGTPANVNIADITDKDGNGFGTCSTATIKTKPACLKASGTWTSVAQNLADGAQKEFWVTLPYNATSSETFKVELKTLAGIAIGDVWSK